jgi:hypothetical protein
MYIEKCSVCGKFMSWASLYNAVVCTPFGSRFDTEPPDEEYIHSKCWDNLTPEYKALIKKTSWQFLDRTRGGQ